MKWHSKLWKMLLGVWNLSLLGHWATNISCINVNVYSPNQFVFGQNPNIPSVLLALESITSGKAVVNNVNPMLTSMKSFILMESSEKIRRALHQKVRPCTAFKYRNGVLVYFKRNKSNCSMGLGTVIRTVNSIKH